MLFKNIQGKVIQVVQLVLLKIPYDMDQVAEDGARPGNFTDIPGKRGIFTFPVFQAAKVNKY
jgi:hypothetical protein